MAYKDLHEFVRRLEREGELKRISVEADVDLEITEITDRVSKAGGPALLFEKPRSAENSSAYSMPLLINMLGSKRRMELALEVSSLEDVARRIEDLLDMKPKAMVATSRNSSGNGKARVSASRNSVE